MTDYASEQSISVGNVVLGSAYAGFIRGNVTDYEKETTGLGYGVAYHGDEGEATVYVYNKNQCEIPCGASSKVVMEEFNRATREVVELGSSTGKAVDLVDRYETNSAERSGEYLCAEFVLSDKHGARRTLLYLTGANNWFVKIRITVHGNDTASQVAHNFADAVASELWRKNDPTDKAAHSIAGKNWRMSNDRYEILGLVSIALFGSRLWCPKDLDGPTIRGAVFQCYDENDDFRSLGSILVGDISNDPDELDIASLTQQRVAEVDRFLESEARNSMAKTGRRLVKWMSSQLNETPNLKGLCTAYMTECEGRRWQYIDLRIPVKGRKMVVSGCFDVEQAGEFAAQIVATLRDAVILDYTLN